MAGVPCGSGGTGPFAEGGGDEGDGAAGGTPFDLGDGFGERVEEDGAGDGDAAADDDAFRVDDIDDGGDAAGEGVEGAVPDGDGVRVSCGDGVDEGAGGLPAACGAGGDVVIACEEFEAAGHVSDGGRAVEVEAEVAEVAGAAEVAAEETTV